MRQLLPAVIAAATLLGIVPAAAADDDPPPPRMSSSDTALHDFEIPLSGGAVCTGLTFASATYDYYPGTKYVDERGNGYAELDCTASAPLSVDVSAVVTDRGAGGLAPEVRDAASGGVTRTDRAVAHFEAVRLDLGPDVAAGRAAIGDSVTWDFRLAFVADGQHLALCYRAHAVIGGEIDFTPPTECTTDPLGLVLQARDDAL